jgi:hypothetical protein
LRLDRVALAAILAITTGACSAAAPPGAPVATTAPSAGSTVPPTATPVPSAAAAPTIAPTVAPTIAQTVAPASTVAATLTPTAGPTLPKADVGITAQGYAFIPTSVTAQANKPFTLALLNLDAGVNHNVHIVDSAGNEPFKYPVKDFGFEFVEYNTSAVFQVLQARTRSLAIFIRR